MIKRLRKNIVVARVVSSYKNSRWWVKVASIVLIITLGINMIIGVVNFYQLRSLEKKFVGLDVSMATVFDRNSAAYKKDRFCFRESFNLRESSFKCAIEFKISITSEQELGHLLEALQNQKYWESVSYPPKKSGLHVLSFEDLKTNLVCKAAVTRDENLAPDMLTFFCSEKLEESYVHIDY